MRLACPALVSVHLFTTSHSRTESEGHVMEHGPGFFAQRTVEEATTSKRKGGGPGRRAWRKRAKKLEGSVAEQMVNVGHPGIENQKLARLGSNPEAQLKRQTSSPMPRTRSSDPAGRSCSPYSRIAFLQRIGQALMACSAASPLAIHVLPPSSPPSGSRPPLGSHCLADRLVPSARCRTILPRNQQRLVAAPAACRRCLGP